MGQRNDEQVREPDGMPTRYPKKSHRAIKFNDESPMISGATARNYYEEGAHLPTHEPGYLESHTERIGDGTRRKEG